MIHLYGVAGGSSHLLAGWLSLLVGVLGVVVSRVGLGCLSARGVDRDPHVYWVLGLIAPVPAWLIVFSVLLGPSPKLVSAEPWILSAGAGLVGAIVTERLVQRVREAGDPLLYWHLGLAASLPAWGTALLGYALKTVIG